MPKHEITDFPDGDPQEIQLMHSLSKVMRPARLIFDSTQKDLRKKFCNDSRFDPAIVLLT